MATYGYSSGYQGGGPSSVPAGYIEAYAQAGRNIGAGIAGIGQDMGKAIEQYRTRKAETEAADQSRDTLAGLMQQQLSSDPKYAAIQQYSETGQLPPGVTEQDIPRYTQKVQADREMLNKFSGVLGEKFVDMSLAKKKAALGDAVMVLNQYRNDQSNEVRNAAARQQLAIGALQLGQAQREATAAPFFTQALGEVMSMQPGQAPSVPYQDVTQEMLGKYGDKLTPTQMQTLIPMMRRMGQTLPAGLVPTGAKMGPSGIETEYGVPQTLTSVPLEGSTKLRQQLQGGKAVGAPYEVTPQTDNAYLKLSEPQQKVADKFITDFGNEKTIQNLSVAGSFLNQMNSLGVGTPQYKPSDDIALIFSFMKTLDPGSTVREGEFATAANAGGIPDRIVATYNKALKGEFLADDEQRNNFINTAKKSYFGLTTEAKSVADRYRSMAKDRGIPENLVVPSNTFQQAQQFGATDKNQTPDQESQTTGGVKYKVFKK
jgi:hypothetical protein